MFGKITVFCFFASYLVAFGLEVTRLFFRSGVRGAVMLGFAGAGLAAHTLFLAHWWLSQDRSPLSSEFDWCLVAAWILLLFYFHLTWFHPKNPIGLFILPLVIGLIVVADTWASREGFPESPWWGVMHGLFLLLGTVAVMIGFVSGLMYLLQANRLKHKLPPRRGFELPSLEWLGKVSEWTTVASVVLLLLGFLTGVALSTVMHGEIRWSEPVVWSSTVLAGWMSAVALFSFLYRPARQGKKVAYLTLATFCVLVFTLAALLIDPRHGTQRDESRNGASSLEVGSLSFVPSSSSLLSLPTLSSRRCT